MVNVSKRPLGKDFAEGLFDQLARILSNTNRSPMSTFLNAFFTDAEQTMLAKRLAVIAMMREGYSDYMIFRLLNMSSSTVADRREQYDAGEYEAVVRRFGRTKAEKEKCGRQLKEFYVSACHRWGKIAGNGSTNISDGRLIDRDIVGRRPCPTS